MKKILLILLAVLGINAVGFSKIKKLPTEFYSVRWLSSNEENDATLDYMVFRREGSKEFPMSRFRASYAPSAEE